MLCAATPLYCILWSNCVAFSVADPKQKFRFKVRIQIRSEISFGSGFGSGSETFISVPDRIRIQPNVSNPSGSGSATMVALLNLEHSPLVVSLQEEHAGSTHLSLNWVLPLEKTKVP